MNRNIRACVILYVGGEMSENCRQSIVANMHYDSSARAENPQLIEFVPNELEAAHAAVTAYFNKLKPSPKRGKKATKEIIIEVPEEPKPKLESLYDIFHYLGFNPKDVTEVQIAINEALNDPRTRRATIKALENAHVSRYI